MSLGEPRPLTEMELIDFEQSDRCKKNWYAKSLLLTIAEIREQHYYELQGVNAQMGELRSRLNWFETSYNVRAFEPLRAPRVKGQKCPQCSKLGAAKLTGTTAENWICFDCRETWTVNLHADIAAKRSRAESQAEEQRRRRAGILTQQSSAPFPILATTIANGIMTHT